MVYTDACCQDDDDGIFLMVILMKQSVVSVSGTAVSSDVLVLMVSTKYESSVRVPDP